MTQAKEVIPNLIFFNFSVVAFHNMGQLNIQWRTGPPGSLACNPDTRFAALDSLQTIVADFQGSTNQQKPSEIALFNPAINQFEALLTFIKEAHASDSEYIRHMKEFLNDYLMSKYNESIEGRGIGKPIQALFETGTYQEYFDLISSMYFESLPRLRQQEEFFKMLLSIHRSIPQPWNALAAGLTLKKILGLDADGIEAHDKYPAYRIPNIAEIVESEFIPREYASFVKDLQLYLEYAVVHNRPQDWSFSNKAQAPASINAVLFPLIDNGFFRGLLVFVPPDDAFWKNETSIRMQWKRCLSLTQSIRHAFETNLLNTLIGAVKDSEEGRDFLYKAFLHNCYKIQEISFGTLWSSRNTSKPLSVTGYGRRFRENSKKDEPGIYWYRSYRDFDEFCRIKSVGEKPNSKLSQFAGYISAEADILNKMVDSHRSDPYSFLTQYPKIEEINNQLFVWNSESQNPSYYQSFGRFIKWRMILPVLQGDDLRAVYFLYYRDPLCVEDIDGRQRVVLLSEVADNTEKERQRSELFSSRARQIMKFFSTIEAHEESYRQVRRHSTKAAVSAIISRNHSHHIGSHVTPRTTVEKIRERLTELRGTWDLAKQLKALGFMREQLDDYIQRKADFMAEIATDPISSTSNKALFGEIILPFIQNSLLMDNIAANEGIHYRNRNGEPDAVNRLKIRAKIKKEKTAEEESEELSCKLKGNCDCDSDYSSLTIPYGSFCKCGPEHRLNLVSPVEKDIVIALPGQLGEFAIYCFLENLIRNSVKHSPKRLGTEEDVNIFLEVSKFPEGHPYRNDFYSVEIYDTITKPDIPINGKPLIDHLINFKNDKIIENDGRLKSGAWGIAEMKIMATLLAGSTDFLTMESNLEICRKKIDGHDRLVYKLRFMRPKQVAVIGEKRPDETIEKRHKDRGIFWFDSLKEYKEKVMSGLSPAAFEFLVVPSDQVEAYQQYAHLCPYRVLVVRENNQNSGVVTGMVSIAKDEVDRWAEEVDPDGIDRIVLGCWRNWVSELKQKHFSGNKISLGLYLQQEKTLQPTGQYITIAEEHNQSNPNSCFSLITDTKDAEVVPEPKAKPKWLIFDRHFGGWGKLYSSYKRREDGLSFSKDILFHEAFGKSSSDFVSIFSGKPSIDKIFALAEAAMLRILVLDERVAEVAHNIIPGFADAHRYGKDGKRIFIAKYAGIFIATHIRVDDMAPEPLHESVKDKSPCCCAWIKTCKDGSIASVTSHWCEANHSASGAIGQEQSCDALLIHQGVAESRALKDVVTRNGAIDFKKAFAQFIKDASLTIPYIVVHSGRGIPANLPNTSKFMPFSRLEEYIMKDRLAKFSLTQRIMTIIRRKSQ